jgi:hypothetical protein
MAGRIYLAAFLASASTGLIGLIAAPGVASAAVAGALAGAAGSAARGAALGGTLSQASLAEGGIVTGPTMALIGEAGENEAVLPLSALSRMLHGSSGGEIHVHLEADGRELAEVVVPNMPDVLRYHGAT